MAWFWLLAAGSLEVLFVALLKLSDGFTKPGYSIGFLLASCLSFYCLTKSIQVLPVGTAYAIWTGIGASGAALLGIAFFGEAVNVLRVLFLFTLICSIVGLKFVTPT
jgi:quaternary ammonium compound-resistance protein SugE